MERYLTPFIEADLRRKMVFLGGPRQVGKTTLAMDLLNPARQAPHPAYLNWDVPEDRKAITQVQLPADQPLIIFDEIHKYSKWRNLVKGIYDKYRAHHSFIITGSARLDYYRRGGDSLQGRYHYYRLHPLSAGELMKAKQDFSLARFLELGGFPEPFLSSDVRDYKRWQRERVSRVVSEDLHDLEKVMDISSLRLLIDALPGRVSSPLSIKSIAEDLQVANKTIARWINILENLYFCFRLSPFGAPKIRAVKKEQKLYLWDWSQCVDEGSRFENMVASQLLKYCHFLEDTEGEEMELRYLRDTDKREVDFVVSRNKKPLFAVECKLHDTAVSPHLKYFKERTKIEKWYQVHLGTKHYNQDNIEVIPFLKFVENLDLP